MGQVIFIIVGQVTLYFPIERQIRERSTYINSFQYVIVPGNHDCDFKDDSIRDIVIDRILLTNTKIDDNIIAKCLEPQKNFWNFLSRITGVNYEPCISYKVEVRLTLDENIVFHCYNSSFLSTLNEKIGSLIIPKEKYLYRDGTKEKVVISLFHHNTGWLSPGNTQENPKKMFESHLIDVSDIVMCGHEHSLKQQVVTSLEKKENIIYLEGGAFQYNDMSEFGILKYDTSTKEIENLRFKYDADELIYRNISASNNIFYLHKKIIGITLDDVFYQWLNSIDIPIKHPLKENLILPDIFVYQDLEPIETFSTKYIQYINSKSILKNDFGGKITIIEGDTQSGKSSLMKMLFLNFYDKGMYPLLIKGKDIKAININEQIKKAYKQQYNNDSFSYEKFKQLNKDKKIIIVEDLNESYLNNEGKSALLNELIKFAEKIIVTTKVQNDIKSLIISSQKESDVKRFHLKSLGYEKRNELIEKWIRLGQDPFTCDNIAIEHEIKLTFDQISNLLGEQYVPSYPIFILSFLQGLNGSLRRFDISQTSYAFCYYSLMIAALYKAEVPHNKIEGIIKFLSEFSYELYCLNKDSFTKDEFYAFYTKHKETYFVSFTPDKLLEILFKSYIIKDESENFCIPYKYIYYYLISLKISSIDNKKEQEKIVTNLCNNLHKEREANILIFLVNHSNISFIIDELLLTTMLPFNEYDPITLDTTDKLFTMLNDLVDDIGHKVLRDDVNPHEERIKLLKKSDEISQKISFENEKINDEDFEKDENLKDINDSFKIVKILGQIVKNQKDTFSKNQIVSLIKQSYYVSFRSISFFVKMIDDAQDEIVNLIKDKKLDIKADAKIEVKIQKLLQMMLYRVCLSFFSNLSLSIGTPNMKEVFNDIAKDIGTPAARIVSFTINTYYNKLNVKELKDLVDEFENNPVVLEIIRARVVNYVYHNSLDYNIRQQIGSICKLKLVNKAGYMKYIKENVKLKSNS